MEKDIEKSKCLIEKTLTHSRGRGRQQVGGECLENPGVGKLRGAEKQEAVDAR